MFKSFNRCAPFNSPTSFLPRVAGEDEAGGLNNLNGLNVLNGDFLRAATATHRLRGSSGSCSR
jgi:hypothetical protein